MKDAFVYNFITKNLRNFFQDELGYIEVPAQSRLSILAACEDPTTIAQFNFGGVDYPLPQTGQMWLERELLENQDWPGVFCVSTSYRNEKNPIPGRHDKIFPMFEFESKGDFGRLINLEKSLLEFLGFDKKTFRTLEYEDACTRYGVETLEAEHEERIERDYGTAVFLQRFPQRTHPFWNMKHDRDGIYNKVDVLLHGMETIGSAERSTNVDEMREDFITLSDGRYSQLLYGAFGEDRVMAELDDYLSLKMFPRFGGGIGVTRMARAMELADLLPKKIGVEDLVTIK